jgi:hypothetical protein
LNAVVPRRLIFLAAFIDKPRGAKEVRVGG